MSRPDFVSSRSFHGAAGGSEHFICVEAAAGGNFREQLEFVQERYREAQKGLGLAPETAVFRRVFLSDVLNQAALVRESPLVEEAVAVSIVQQPPLPDAKIALLAHHIVDKTPIARMRLSPRHLLVTKNGHRHLWSTRLCCGDRDTSISSATQTHEIFEELIRTLGKFGATLSDHCVRTWLYMKDVDVFYKGMVDSRRELFHEHGLSADTHYIASTGIQGACAHRHDLVSMDAYSNLDLVKGQTSYLNDFERLCPTKDYSVTFERGTRIAYADRAHHFISGTASIDKAGDVVHPGDVLLQLERALENTDALLRSGAATLDDMMYLLVYLRDAADFAAVNAYLRERMPNVPRIIVEGPVCRPAWLVEVEGVAVTGNDAPHLPSF
jgi:enamine deaminase RidA (YjgF/YER057c/UK114 family)